MDKSIGLNSTVMEVDTKKKDDKESGTTKEIAIFIHPENYPEFVFDAKAQETILETLSDGIDKDLEASICITRTLCLDGYVKLIVEDKATAKWVKDTFKKIEGTVVAGSLPPKKDLFVKATLRIRKREKSLNQKQLIEHLMKRNKGLDLSGSYIEDYTDLERRETESSSSAQATNRKIMDFRLIIFKLDQKAMDWLTKKDGKVFYDLESTKFLWPELKTKLNEAKKAKLDRI